jgi:hypothetical protein
MVESRVKLMLVVDIRDVTGFEYLSARLYLNHEI